MRIRVTESLHRRDLRQREAGVDVMMDLESSIVLNTHELIRSTVADLRVCYFSLHIQSLCPVVVCATNSCKAENLLRNLPRYSFYAYYLPAILTKLIDHLLTIILSRC